MEHFGRASILLMVLVSNVLCQSDIKTQPPKIIVQGVKRMPFRAADTVKIPCRASGVPTPQFSWYRDDEYLEIGNDLRMVMVTGEGTLSITSPEDKDQGFYQCNATNAHGTSLSVKTMLQQSNLASFPSTVVQVHQPVLGSALKLSCVPPTSFPRAKVYWGISKTNSPFDPIVDDDRVTQDFDGNLYFAHIMPSDHRNGERYACMAENPYLQMLVRGADAVITPTGNNIDANPVNLVWSSPTNTIGLKGETLELKCIFSGKPTPAVSWVRDGGKRKLPVDVVYESANTKLVLPKLTFDHAGSYECIGRNENTQSDGIRKTFQVKVASEPFWIEKPSDRSVAEDETVVFRCKAGGDPSPQIEWFINGISIRSDKIRNARRFQNGVHEVKFVNLTSDDAQVIQCNASNIWGYKFADVFLNVISEPPSFIESPKTDKIAAGPRSYNFTCRVRGAPTPLIWWEKDGTAISGGTKYTIHADGTLEIKWIQSTDAGTYVCNAKNKFGSDKTDATLIVREPTKIRQKPRGMTVDAGSQAKFICTATTDPDEMGKLSIEWKKDDDFIDYSAAQRVFKNRRDNALTISGTIPLDTGRYTCVASNGLDSDEAVATLYVLAKPEPPTDVIVTQCSQRSAQIKWNPGSDNNSPILSFIVEYSTSFTPSVWVKHNQEIARSKSDAFVTISPWGNYTFRVRGKNVIGMGLPSAGSKPVCRTAIAVPDQVPDNVRTIDKGISKLWIQWTPMPLVDHNGPDFYYTVQYQRLDDNSKIQDVQIKYKDPYYHHERYWLELDGVATYKPYKISVGAGNSLGTGPPPQPIVGFSGESEPNVAPTGFKLDESYTISSHEAKFEWDAVDPDNANMNGWMTGYQVEFWKDKQDNTIRYLKIPLSGRKPSDEYAKWQSSLIGRKKRQTVQVLMAIVVNLPAYARVNARVRVMNKRYAGPPSNTVLFNTPEGTPGPVINLAIVGTGSNHVDLKWSRPDEPNGIIRGYNIYFQEVKVSGNRNILGGKQPRLPQLDLAAGDDPLTITSRLAGLKEKTHYRVYVHARTIVGEGLEDYIETDTGKPRIPGRPSFTISDIGLTTMNITWSPDKKNPGGGFFVKYRKEGRNYWEHTAIQSNLAWINITNLEPGVVYEVQVWSYNGLNYQKGSGTQSVEMLGKSPIISRVSSAAWFIGLLVALIILTGGLIAICVVKRQRAGRYPVQEKEALRGGYTPSEPEESEHRFAEYTRGGDPNLNRSRGSMESEQKPLESDSDSMEEYMDDAGKFNEDGSFIGQYGAKKRDDRGREGDPSAPAAFSTIV